MKYTSIFPCLIIFFFMLSCANKGMNPRKNLTNHPQTEIYVKEHQKLVPLHKEKKNYVPGEILIRFRAGTDEQAIETIQRKLHLTTIKIVSRPNLYLMKILDGSSVEKIMERLQDFQKVKYSEPNHIVTAY